MSGVQLTALQVEQVIRQHPELAAALLIKGKALTIFRYCQRRWETTSADVAQHFRISVQNAGVQLSKLADKGYLIKIPDIADSGGPENRYRVAEHLTENNNNAQRRHSSGHPDSPRQ